MGNEAEEAVEHARAARDAASEVVGEPSGARETEEVAAPTEDGAAAGTPIDVSFLCLFPRSEIATYYEYHGKSRQLWIDAGRAAHSTSSAFGFLPAESLTISSLVTRQFFFSCSFV